MWPSNNTSGSDIGMLDKHFEEAYSFISIDLVGAVFGGVAGLRGWRIHVQAITNHFRYLKWRYCTL